MLTLFVSRFQWEYFYHAPITLFLIMTLILWIAIVKNAKLFFVSVHSVEKTLKAPWLLNGRESSNSIIPLNFWRQYLKWIVSIFVKWSNIDCHAFCNLFLFVEVNYHRICCIKLGRFSSFAAFFGTIWSARGRPFSVFPGT